MYRVRLSLVLLSYIKYSSVAQLCPTLGNPMDCSTPGFPVYHQLQELTQTHVHHQSVMPSNHLILCHPLLLLPSIFPSISVFSNESALLIRWPTYWSFSFIIVQINWGLPRGPEVKDLPAGAGGAGRSLVREDST